MKLLTGACSNEFQTEDKKELIVSLHTGSLKLSLRGARQFKFIYFSSLRSPFLCDIKLFKRFLFEAMEYSELDYVLV